MVQGFEHGDVGMERQVAAFSGVDQGLYGQLPVGLLLLALREPLNEQRGIPERYEVLTIGQRNRVVEFIRPRHQMRGGSGWRAASITLGGSRGGGRDGSGKRPGGCRGSSGQRCR